MRNAVGALAERGAAGIDILMLDDRPVSMQLIVRAGAAAFTWKTTYDERFRDYSPGTLLLEDYTASFLADPAVAYVDSCAYDETSFMSAWAERQAVADIWLDVRPGGSPAFRMLGALQTAYRAARLTAKRVYLAARAHRRPVRAKTADT
jgi:CelD/BcsL family acetyltransferase involved in cellulose biosynthesis